MSDDDRLIIDGMDERSQILDGMGGDPQDYEEEASQREFAHPLPFNVREMSSVRLVETVPAGESVTVKLRGLGNAGFITELDCDSPNIYDTLNISFDGVPATRPVTKTGLWHSRYADAEHTNFCDGQLAQKGVGMRQILKPSDITGIMSSYGPAIDSDGNVYMAYDTAGVCRVKAIDISEDPVFDVQAPIYNGQGVNEIVALTASNLFFHSNSWKPIYWLNKTTGAAIGNTDVARLFRHDYIFINDYIYCISSSTNNIFVSSLAGVLVREVGAWTGSHVIAFGGYLYTTSANNLEQIKIDTGTSVNIVAGTASELLCAWADNGYLYYRDTSGDLVCCNITGTQVWKGTAAGYGITSFITDAAGGVETTVLDKDNNRLIMLIKYATTYGVLVVNATTGALIKTTAATQAAGLASPLYRMLGDKDGFVNFLVRWGVGTINRQLTIFDALNGTEVFTEQENDTTTKKFESSGWAGGHGKLIWANAEALEANGGLWVLE